MQTNSLSKTCLLLSLLVTSVSAQEFKAGPRTNVSKKERKSVLALEKSVQTGKDELAKKGYSIEDFNKKVIPELLSLNAQELEMGIHDDRSEINQYIVQWQAKNTQQQQLLDQSILAKEKYFINQTWAKVKKIHKKAPLNIQEQLQGTLDAMKSDYGVWKKNQNTIQGPDQKERLYPYQSFFKGLQKYLESFKKLTNMEETEVEEVDEVDATCSSPESSTSFNPITKISKLFSEGIAPKFQMTASGLSAFFNILYSGAKEGKTPLTSSFNQLFKTWAQKDKFNVTISGAENIPAWDTAYPVVKLILPSHRHPIGDAMIMSKINMPHYLIFANPAAFMPVKILGQKMASAPEFVGVGKWRGKGDPKPADKAVSSLKMKISSNILNYPQGFTATMNEVLAVNPAFDEVLVGRLIKEGFQVVVVPVSYEVGSEFLLPQGQTLPKDLEAKFHSNLPPQVVQYMVTGEKWQWKALLATYLRGVWLENIKRHAELNLEEIEKRLQKIAGEI